MKEYIFKTTTQEEWQKWLNQWKHRYHIDILKIVDKDELCTLYITRTPKREQNNE